MARRRRRQPFPLDLAEGISSVWALLFVGTVVLPRMFGGSPPPLPNDTLLMLIGGAVLVAASWAWAFVCFKRQNARGKQLEELQAMPPSAFEEWAGARFRERGYAVRVTGTHGTGGDHGIDLVAKKDGETAIVQVKKFVTKAVGEPVLRDLYGAMTAAGADRAYLVTTGRVTDPAREWASGKPIEIWDAETVTRLSLGENGSPADTDNAREVARADLPHCPRCGATMAERRNSRTGERFFGCSTYPRCQQTLPAPS